MAKKSKRQNKLSALLLLLFITAVMLGTATFAWFTSNRTVTIEDIEINVVASSGLQISTDAVTWKTVISTEDITEKAYADNLNQVPMTSKTQGAASPELVPVSTAGTVTGGYLEMFQGTVKAGEDGVFKLSAVKDTETKGTTGHFVAFDLFLKLDNVDTTTNDAKIYLTKSSNVRATDLEEGVTSYGLEYASRVAFILEGNKDSTEDASTVTGLHSGTSAIIWEPNADMHTQAGINNAKSYYSAITGVNSLTAGASSEALPYDGVKDVIATTAAIPLENTNATTNPTKFGSVTTKPTNKSRTSSLEIFGLKSGITKVRVYYWVEGQDVDCENNASGHKITLSFGFSLDENDAVAQG